MERQHGLTQGAHFYGVAQEHSFVLDVRTLELVYGGHGDHPLEEHAAEATVNAQLGPMAGP